MVAPVSRTGWCLPLIALMGAAGLACPKDRSDGEASSSSARGAAGQGAVSTSSIAPLLDALVRIRNREGHPVDDFLNPPLTRAQVLEASEPLGFEVPPEVIALYTWHDGTKPGAPLLFRDMRFLPMDEALEAHAAVSKTYDRVGLDVDLDTSFPIAEFEGAYYVIATRGHEAHPAHPRPVVSVFEGIEVHFYSLEHMLRTLRQWYEEGDHGKDAVTLPRGREIEIWKKHNPGLFEP